MSNVTILELQTLPFGEIEEGAGLYGWANSPAVCTIVEGETYRVKWDTVEYTCTAYSTTFNSVDGIALGNGGLVGCADPTGEPFLLGNSNDGQISAIYTTDVGDSHTIAIYQVDASDVQGSDIVLRDRSGNPVTYPGVNYIKVNRADGGTQGFAAYDPATLIPDNLAAGVVVGDVTGTLSTPQLLENVPVTLDLSAGNQTIAAPDGMAVKTAIIQKPATLLPENIAEGVDIAGIIGTLAAGGGGSKALVYTSIANYSLTATSSSTAIRLATASQLANSGIDLAANNVWYSDSHPYLLSIHFQRLLSPGTLYTTTCRCVSNAFISNVQQKISATSTYGIVGFLQYFQDTGYLYSTLCGLYGPDSAPVARWQASSANSSNFFYVKDGDLWAILYYSSSATARWCLSGRYLLTVTLQPTT